jgi:hypothetical protein
MFLKKKLKFLNFILLYSNLLISLILIFWKISKQCFKYIVTKNLSLSACEIILDYYFLKIAAVINFGCFANLVSILICVFKLI